MLVVPVLVPLPQSPSGAVREKRRMTPLFPINYSAKRGQCSAKKGHPPVEARLVPLKSGIALGHTVARRDARPI
ncbi:hypothetical protein Pla52o_00100 [Novipirellula galeiformis]|uniref:Uncharacterized protein n=1 Tax=Novipirellula galeiformis TaxID=2528004 RepID=A0A5C6CP40_9BACT|nr:hypothetical protein Pla52o_00100 [Novipirellula galeiformis]